MIIIQHGKYVESGHRRVFTCKRCKCVFMPEESETIRTPDGADYAAECPDCGLVGRNYRMEERAVLKVEGPQLREFFRGKE